jgi:hypothetical protein
MLARFGENVDVSQIMQYINPIMLVSYIARTIATQVFEENKETL